MALRQLNAVVDEARDVAFFLDVLDDELNTSRIQALLEIGRVAARSTQELRRANLGEAEIAVAQPIEPGFQIDHIVETVPEAQAPLRF